MSYCKLPDNMDTFVYPFGVRINWIPLYNTKLNFVIALSVSPLHFYVGVGRGENWQEAHADSCIHVLRLLYFKKRLRMFCVTYQGNL